MSYSEKDGSAVLDGERYHRIGGPLPKIAPGPFIATYAQRPANPGALAAMNNALAAARAEQERLTAARAEQERWTAAGLLATFRNWRNRR